MANGIDTTTDVLSPDYLPFSLPRRRDDVRPPLALPPGPVDAVAAATAPPPPAVAPAPTPTGPQATPAAVGDIGQEAATPSPLGPVLQRSRWALTQPPGNYQPVPTYGQASENVAAGTPGAGQSLTKLGKLLTILHAAGQGAMIGSTQPTFGTGAMASEQFQNQQEAQLQARQAHQMGLEVQRQNLAMLPLQRAWQMQQMGLNQELLRQRAAELKQRSDTEAARAERQRQLATQPQKPIVSGDRLLRPALPTDDPDKVDENGYVDIGPAPTKPQKPDTIDREVFDSLTRQGKTPAQAYQIMHPHEWQQQQAAAATAPPVTAPQALQDELGKLPPEVQTGLGRFNPTTQQALIALAHGDVPLSAWSARGMYKNNPGGLSQADAVGWARAINPSWDDTLFNTKKGVNARYTNSKQEGGQLEAFSNFLNHAGDAADVIAKWRDKFLVNGSPWINTGMNKLRDQLAGDPDYRQLVAALEPVKKEYMSFLNANRAEHTQDLQTMDKITSDSSTPAQLEMALKQLAKTAVLRLDSLDQNYRTATGGHQFPNLITPKAKQAAAKLGYGDAVAGYGSGGTMPGYGQTAPTQAAPTPAKQSKASKYGVEIQ